MTLLRPSRLLALSLTLATAFAPVAAAQNVPTAGSMSFVFAAPCETLAAGSGSFAGSLPEAGRPLSACAPFIRTNDSYRTPDLRRNTSLNIGLYLMNPARVPIGRVQVWLAYDPQALSGTSLVVSPAFPTVDTAQTGIFPDQGYIKIVAEAGATLPSDERILVATLTVRAIATATMNTPISIYGADSGAQTAVMSAASSGTTLLDLEQPSLMVQIVLPTPLKSTDLLGSGATLSSSSAAASLSSQSPLAPNSISLIAGPDWLTGGSSSRPLSPGLPLSAAEASEWKLAQVQNVAVSTTNGSALVAWQTLLQPGVAGYYVYYSSVSGVYTQRRTLSAAATGDEIGNLQNGERYFFAVRAFNMAGEQSDYSREVAVVIGQPDTSTAPLNAVMMAQINSRTGPVPVAAQMLPTPRRPMVAGKTGVSDMFNVLLGLAAATGMLGAFRRQLSSTPANV